MYEELNNLCIYEKKCNYEKFHYLKQKKKNINLHPN